MILKPIDGDGHIGIWPTDIIGTVRITTYGNINATYDAETLIDAIQKQAA